MRMNAYSNLIGIHRTLMQAAVVAVQVEQSLAGKKRVTITLSGIEPIDIQFVTLDSDTVTGMMADGRLVVVSLHQESERENHQATIAIHRDEETRHLSDSVGQ